MTKAEIELLMVQVGFPANSLDIGSSIALAESGGNPSIGPNASGDVGLFQINIPAHPQYSIAQMKDPVQNAKAALAISGNGTSWRLWCTAYSDGACGTRGGIYQGAGSPYLKFLGGSVSPTPSPTPISQPIQSTGTTVFHSIGSGVHDTLNSVPGFVGIVEALDQIEQFQPMTIGDISLFGQDRWSHVTTSDLIIPAGNIQALLTFIIANTAAAFIRGILIFIGIVCLVALAHNVLHSHYPTIDDLLEQAA